LIIFFNIELHSESIQILKKTNKKASLNGIINNLLIYLDFPHKFNGLPPLQVIKNFFHLWFQ